MEMEHTQQEIDRAVKKISSTLKGMRRHNEVSNSVREILALSPEDLKALTILFESGVVTTRWALLQESMIIPTTTQVEPGETNEAKQPLKRCKDLESAAAGGKGKKN